MADQGSDLNPDKGGRQANLESPPSGKEKKTVFPKAIPSLWKEGVVSITSLLAGLRRWVCRKPETPSAKATAIAFILLLLGMGGLEIYTRYHAPSSYSVALVRKVSEKPVASDTSPQEALPACAAGQEKEGSQYLLQTPQVSGESVPSKLPEKSSIAIVLTELGLMPTLNEKVLRLPPSVTLAVFPFAPDVQQIIDSFASKRHEVVVMIPMEPIAYPEQDPGPRTLLSGLPSQENVERLRSHVQSLEGFKGLMNYMGSRFTTSEKDFSPILSEMKSIGGYFLDANSAPRCLTKTLAEKTRVPYALTTLCLDHVLSPEGIQSALEHLERTALEKGYAIACSKAYPLVIETIAAWLPTLSGKNIQVVPLSELLTVPSSEEPCETEEERNPSQKAS